MEKRNPKTRLLFAQMKWIFLVAHIHIPLHRKQFVYNRIDTLQYCMLYRRGSFVSKYEKKGKLKYIKKRFSTKAQHTAKTPLHLFSFHFMFYWTSKVLLLPCRSYKFVKKQKIIIYIRPWCKFLMNGYIEEVRMKHIILIWYNVTSEVEEKTHIRTGRKILFYKL